MDSQLTLHLNPTEQRSLKRLKDNLLQPIRIIIEENKGVKHS